MPDTFANAKVLIVAPDADLRNSLAFMLRAEGCDVDTQVEWKPEDDLAGHQALIMDHGSLPKGFSGNDALTQLGARLVLLASSPVQTPPPGIRHATMVRKPLLNHALLDGLRVALAAPPT